MSTARCVKEMDLVAMDWFTVEDEDGAVYRYVKARRHHRMLAVQVGWQPTLEPPGWRPTLIRDRDKLAILRQDGPGLPPIAFVDPLRPMRTPGGHASDRDGTCEYSLQ